MKRLIFLLLLFPSLVYSQTNKKISEMDTLTTLVPSNYWPIVDESEGVPIDRNKRLTYYRLRTTLDSRYIQSAGATYVEAASTFGTDNVMLKSDGTSRGAQATGITISDLNAISGVATIDTGQGANELYDMNQNVQTTDAVTFATVNTGNGANELYPMNQAVQTTSGVTFGSVVVNSLTIDNDDITSSGDIELRPTGQVFIPDNLSVVGEAAIGNPTYTDPAVGTAYDLKLGGTGNGIAVAGSSLFKAATTFQSTTSFVGTATFSPGATGDGTTVFTTDGASWAAGIDDSFSNNYIINPGTSLSTSAGYLALSAGSGTIGVNVSGTLGVTGETITQLVTFHNNNNSATGYGLNVVAGQDAGNGQLVLFSDGDFTTVGSITFETATTSYNTTSDYRLKKRFRSFDGLQMARDIPVYRFNWKENNSEGYGVKAHELQEVIPYAVTGEKDGEEMQQVDYSKIVPILLKAIQELEARVIELENTKK